MITDSAAWVMFAVRSAVRLGAAARTAYVDATRRRELVLPLPNFFAGANEFDANTYFAGPGKKYVDGFVLQGEAVPGSARLDDLLARFAALSGDEKREFVELHAQHRCLDRLEAEGGQLEENGLVDEERAFLAAVTVRQWRRGADPTPSTLHRIAGTLVEIGIDYAVSDPALFDPRSSRGKAVKGFLQGLQQVSFAEGDPAEIPPRLFVAALESLDANQELVSGDPKVLELIQVTTRALSADVSQRIRAIQQDPSLDAAEKQAARRDVGAWGERVFRSLLASGGQLVLDRPGEFLGVRGAGQEALVTEVGGVMLDWALEKPGGLRDGLTASGLDTLLRTALGVLGDHPDLLGHAGPKGVRQLLSQVAGDLSQMESLRTPDVLPEVARLVLSRTAENVELFWPDRGDHPERNLILRAARVTLAELSAPPPAGQIWKLRFTPSQAIGVADAMTDELVNNPGWLLDGAGDWRGTLEIFLSGMLRTLRQQNEPRLSSQLALDLLRVALQSVRLRQEFLSALPSGQPVVAELVDVVLGVVLREDLDPASAWQVVRAEVIITVTEIGLRTLAKFPLGEPSIQAMLSVLRRHVDALAGGKLLDLPAYEKALIRKLKSMNN